MREGAEKAAGVEEILLISMVGEVLVRFERGLALLAPRMVQSWAVRGIPAAVSQLEELKGLVVIAVAHYWTRYFEVVAAIVG